MVPWWILFRSFLFFSPLFAFVYYLRNKILKSESIIRKIIVDHILVVIKFSFLTMIVIVFVGIIATLRPNLINYDYIWIWNIGINSLIILIVLLFTYLLPNKIFTKYHLNAIRIAKGKCINCAKKLPDGVNACPFCGHLRYTNCKKCGKETYKDGTYCMDCGEIL